MGAILLGQPNTPTMNTEKALLLVLRAENK